MTTHSASLDVPSLAVLVNPWPDSGSDGTTLYLTTLQGEVLIGGPDVSFDDDPTRGISVPSDAPLVLRLGLAQKVYAISPADAVLSVLAVSGPTTGGPLLTPAQVQARTGAVGVTIGKIALASEMVATATGLDLSLDPLPYRKSDLRRVTTAIMWQAVYLAAHPDVTTAAGNIASAATNGVSVSYVPGGDAVLLAPLAVSALKGVSWARTRSLAMRPTSRTPSRAQTLTDDGDDASWSPLR